MNNAGPPAWFFLYDKKTDRHKPNLLDSTLLKSVAYRRIIQFYNLLLVGLEFNAEVSSLKKHEFRIR